MSNKKNGKTELISKRAVKVAINNAFSDAFNGYFVNASKSVEENITANKESIRKRLKVLHKSINNMPVIATAQYTSNYLADKALEVLTQQSIDGGEE